MRYLEYLVLRRLGVGFFFSISLDLRDLAFFIHIVLRLKKHWFYICVGFCKPVRPDLQPVLLLPQRGQPRQQGRRGGWAAIMGAY